MISNTFEMDFANTHTQTQSHAQGDNVVLLHTTTHVCNSDFVSVGFMLKKDVVAVRIVI